MEQFLQMQHAAAETQPAPQSEPVSTAQQISTLLGGYIVGSGDDLVVALTSVEQTGLPDVLDVRVDRDGEIDLPLVGKVNISGKALDAVEDAVVAAFVPAVFRALSVHVQVREALPTNVLVVGAVASAGLVPLQRHQRNMLFAIVAAGGASSDASGMVTLRPLRQPNERIAFNLRDPVELRRALAIPPLEDGDILYVHAAAPNMIFVGGLVHLIGPQTYPRDSRVTILQVVAAAGGLRSDLIIREGTLTRRMPDGEDVRVKLDLPAIARGEQENLVLAAGDILWVPHTWETKIQDFIVQNVFIRAGVSVNYSVSGIEFLNRQDQQSLSSGTGGGLQDSFDPLGFLGRSSALQTLITRVPVVP